ncbi:MAG TPA: bifunctional aldolase/short-chain dehydrogenase [Verrucomicrobiales bacterium]|nr:bifunctional aldolase/short-chain dehydrogenase [Verrucomicrobiales bacterium]
MKSRWNDEESAAWSGDPVGLRVYTSRLLGAEPDLVLHGGGNTSVKVRARTFLGDEEALLYVKGSGWDLAMIERGGFAPVRLDRLLRLAAFEQLSDAAMVREVRASMTDPDAPTPSIEALAHAVLPFVYVDHTHAAAVLALTNNERADELLAEVYGSRVALLPYIMPGFFLAKQMRQLAEEVDLGAIEGIILRHHGVFTFGDDARTSYERMISLVNEAEAYLESKAPGERYLNADGGEDLEALAELRRGVSRQSERAVIASWDRSPAARGFAAMENVDSLSTRGPVTPDHAIRTKRCPLVVRNSSDEMLEVYAANYRNYFQRFAPAGVEMLDPAPRWIVWPGFGIVSFGKNPAEARAVGDIATQTIRVVQDAERVGSWLALPERDIFAIEYWELEQAKLRRLGAPLPFAGKIALVTGAAAGIGRACVEALHAEGAAVVGLDLNPEVAELEDGDRKGGIVCDLTDHARVRAAVEDVIRRFGGLDLLVSNAGIFTAGAYIEDLDPVNWEKSIAVNLTSHQRLLQYCIPYLKRGVDASAIFIGSRNVQAPGAGAASYSVTKAGLTQLARVAALELAKDGARVNIIHPDAVFDTRLWTPEALQRSAERYGLSVEEYKTRNLLKTEISSADVARMVCAVAGPAFARTTGAQIPVDGGNDRVI